MCLLIPSCKLYFDAISYANSRMIILQNFNLPTLCLGHCPPPPPRYHPATSYFMVRKLPKKLNIVFILDQKKIMIMGQVCLLFRFFGFMFSIVESIQNIILWLFVIILLVIMLWHLQCAGEMKIHVNVYICSYYGLVIIVTAFNRLTLTLDNVFNNCLIWCPCAQYLLFWPWHFLDLFVLQSETIGLGRHCGHHNMIIHLIISYWP